MFLIKIKDKIHLWLQEKSQSKTAEWWLAGISFAESSFFPIPPDPFLVASLLVKQNRWLRNSLIVTIFSVLGGIFGYVIGFWFFNLFGEKLVAIYHFEEELLTMSNLFNDNTFWTMFIAAFTPIPYKIFTLTAGLFHVNIISFIIASVIGRGLRFITIGYIMKIFGQSIGKMVFKYFNILTFILFLLVAGYVAFKLL